jgi:thiol-disulfide isomerase/thioredoxin
VLAAKADSFLPRIVGLWRTPPLAIVRQSFKIRKKWMLLAKMKTLMFSLVVAATVFKSMAISYPDGPSIGQLAPSLGITNWLQAPPETAQGFPLGKVVVLEFWAESCGPCVHYIPHMNELANTFKHRPVQFVAVTDSNRAEVEQFLLKHPINAWIGIGPNGGFGENTPYRVYAIPHVVLIDSHGRIAAITDPEGLTENMIRKCLRGESLTSRPSGGMIPGLTPEQQLAACRT